MKRVLNFLALSVFALSLTAGCHSQQITPVPVVTAPPVSSTAFAQLNAGTNNGGPVTATTYTDLPATGSSCYFVQELDGSGVSAASNTACFTTTSSLKHVLLNWSAPAGYTCQNAPCTYVVSRAAAVLTPVGVPSLQPSSTTTADLEEPDALPLIRLQGIATR